MKSPFTFQNKHIFVSVVSNISSQHNIAHAKYGEEENNQILFFVHTLPSVILAPPELWTNYAVHWPAKLLHGQGVTLRSDVFASV
jgi:hypothetical protein